MELIAAYKELGAAGVFLFMLAVLWWDLRRQQAECKRDFINVITRYEALLEKVVESLVEVSKEVDDHIERETARVKNPRD